MRKLLQNKAVVTALALVAVASVTANFVKLPTFRGTVVNARPGLPAAPQEASGRPPAHSPAFLHLAAQPWREMFPIVAGVRDPFAPPALAASTNTPVALPPDTAAIPQFHLQATSIEEGRSFAVINQTVLGEGEAIAGYRVEQITPGHVRLSGPLGTVAIAFGRTSPDQKAPTATPSKADLPAATGGPPSGRPKS